MRDFDNQSRRSPRSPNPSVLPRCVPVREAARRNVAPSDAPRLPARRRREDEGICFARRDTVRKARRYQPAIDRAVWARLTDV